MAPDKTRHRLTPVSNHYEFQMVPHAIIWQYPRTNLASDGMLSSLRFAECDYTIVPLMDLKMNSSFPWLPLVAPVSVPSPELEPPPDSGS